MSHPVDPTDILLVLQAVPGGTDPEMLKPLPQYAAGVCEHCARTDRGYLYTYWFEEPGALRVFCGDELLDTTLFKFVPTPNRRGQPRDVESNTHQRSLVTVIDLACSAVRMQTASIQHMLHSAVTHNTDERDAQVAALYKDARRMRTAARAIRRTADEYNLDPADTAASIDQLMAQVAYLLDTFVYSGDTDD